MSSFRVIAANDGHRPIKATHPELSNEPELAAMNDPGSISDCIFLTCDARQTVFEHITWASDTPINAVEQGGLLVGRSYIDEKLNRIYAIVQYAIPAWSAKGSMSYLEFGHTTWKQMLDELDKLIEKEGNSDLQVVGWYHTHPRHLSVFMSGTDLNTQKRMFSKEWQFAIVLNPHKQIWKAFRGEKALECRGEMIR